MNSSLGSFVRRESESELDGQSIHFSVIYISSNFEFLTLKSLWANRTLRFEMKNKKVNFFIVTDITFTEQTLRFHLHYLEIKPKAAAIFTFR